MNMSITVEIYKNRKSKCLKGLVVIKFTGGYGPHTSPHYHHYHHHHHHHHHHNHHHPNMYLIIITTVIASEIAKL